jgi:hypothetical protein
MKEKPLFETKTPGGQTPPWRREEKNVRHGKKRISKCQTFFSIFYFRFPFQAFIRNPIFRI